MRWRGFYPTWPENADGVACARGLLCSALRPWLSLCFSRTSGLRAGWSSFLFLLLWWLATDLGTGTGLPPALVLSLYRPPLLAERNSSVPAGFSFIWQLNSRRAFPLLGRSSLGLLPFLFLPGYSIPFKLWAARLVSRHPSPNSVPLSSRDGQLASQQNSAPSQMDSNSESAQGTMSNEASASAEGGGVPLKKGPWTSQEDAILVAYVSKHGEGNWNNVQKHSGLFRCGKSCRLRWANHLRPNLKKGAFTPEEERLIIELHAKLGNKWARMAAQLPGRTDNEIKNYWNTRIKRRIRAGLPVYPSDVQSIAVPTAADSSYVYNDGGAGAGACGGAESSDCDAVSSSPSSSKLRGHINLANLHGSSSTGLEFNFEAGMKEFEAAGMKNSPIILRRASSKRLRDAGLLFQQQRSASCSFYADEYPRKEHSRESKGFSSSSGGLAAMEYSAESHLYNASGDSSLGSNGGSMLLEALLQEARMIDGGGEGEQQLLLLDNSHAVDDVVTMMAKKTRKFEQHEQQQELWGEESLTPAAVCSVFSEESMNGNNNHWDESSGIVEQPPIATTRAALTATVPVKVEEESVNMGEEIGNGGNAASAYTDEEISTLLDFARADTVPLNLEWGNPPPESNNNNNNSNAAAAPALLPYLCNSTAESVADAFDPPGLFGPDVVEMDHLGGILGAHSSCIWDIGCPPPWSSMPGATQLHDDCKPLASVADPCPIY